MGISKKKTKVLTAFICVVMSLVLVMGFAQQANAASGTIYTPNVTKVSSTTYNIVVPVKVTASHTKVRVTITGSYGISKTVTMTSSSTGKVNVNMGNFTVSSSSLKYTNKGTVKLSYYKNGTWTTAASCNVTWWGGAL